MHRVVAHVPLVVLAPGRTELSVATGTLRTVSYREWLEYDSAFPDRRHRYEQTAPVFFETEFPDVNDLVQSFMRGEDPATRALRSLYRALLVATAARVPRPDLSTSYLVVGDAVRAPDQRETRIETRVCRRIGPYEREVIVFGDPHPRSILDEQAAASVREVQGLVDRVGPAVEPAMAALERTARPGYAPLNEAFHLIVGMEALLVRRGEPLAGDLYALRSDLVHGRQVKRSFRDEDADPHRRLTTWMVNLAMRWLDRHPGAPVTEFHRDLDRASTAGVSLRQDLEATDG